MDVPHILHCNKTYIIRIITHDHNFVQIQTYDNLIGPVVESLKYLTSLSLDVLGYCLLEALCAGRAAPGAAHAPWLQALAAFAGAAFKKHNIELTALLQFVANRLKAQQRLVSF